MKEWADIDRENLLETGRGSGLLEARDEGVLLVISGPSGTGKSTLCHAVMKQFKNIEFSVSFTTRAPREGEVEGRDYYFIDDLTFDKMVADQRLAEWAVVHGNRYGSSLEVIETRTRQGINLILDIDPQGAAQLRRTYPSAVFVFLLPPHPVQLEARLRGRGTDSEAVIQRRLHNARGEVEACTWYDYVIVNDDFDRALEKFAAVILAEKCRRSRASMLLARLMSNYGIPVPASP